MRVFKWGKNLAVRLPKRLVEALDLREGDEIDVHPLQGGAIGIAVRSSVEEHLAALRRLRGTLPHGFRFNRDEANER
jgi:antitoxin MazE